MESLHIFDPRRNLQMQGFTGRAATTTLHDATETGVSISGIFQAAEDFAVLGWWNAYDYFNHLRVKHLPKTDLSGIQLAFDIEYELDGCMRLDASKYPSVTWDSMTFVTGKGDIHNVRLLDHATILSGSETPASVSFEVSGIDVWDGGIDHLHLYFRDTRYSVSNVDVRVTQLSIGPVKPASGPSVIGLPDTSKFVIGDMIVIEREGTNEEVTYVQTVNPGSITAYVTIDHGDNPVYVAKYATTRDVAKRFESIINEVGDEVAGRYGPDQSSVIVAESNGSALTLTFKLAADNEPKYGELGNLDVVTVSDGRVEVEGNGIRWMNHGETKPFIGGSNNIKYRISLDFSSLIDANGDSVPMNDCRKMYMVFAPRFEPTEQSLRDGAFLITSVNASSTNWSVDDSSPIKGGRYFISDETKEERVMVLSAAGGQVQVQRGIENTTPYSWPSGTRMKKVSSVSGFGSDIEWRCKISNITVTGDGSLKVGGEAKRIEENECSYMGYWEAYKYDTGWPTQWWSGGHARRTAPESVSDVRKVIVKYSQSVTHDLYLGTFLDASCGKIQVKLDGGVVGTFDLYLDEYGGTTANLKLKDNIAPGNHTVEITALYDKHPDSTGWWFYFDYLWPLVPQDVPDAPQVYDDVSLAIDFDTDHGYKKPPAWHVWQLEKLGFVGHADCYMGVFWNNKRRRIDATYPWATIEFSGEPEPGEVVSITIEGTTINHAIGYGESLQDIVNQIRTAINGMFVGVWADNNYGSSTTLRVQSKAPSWVFPMVSVGIPNSVTMSLTNNLVEEGNEGYWEMIDSVSPVMTEGARRWIKDLAQSLQAAGIVCSFAFSMECYNAPVGMRAKYLHYEGGVVSPGSDVLLPIPSHHMHFGQRVCKYLRQMYKEAADQIAAAGAPIILQFGETQYWYFDNRGDSIHGDLDPLGGMPCYDQETIDDFVSQKGHQIWPFRSNTDDPIGDPSYPYETANFLRDRIWGYCGDVIDYVRQYHPTAEFECLWPLDANQGKPNSTLFRKLLMHINLPEEWKNSSYGVKYFRCEGFDYDVWQKNTSLMEDTMLFPYDQLARPASECMYLMGIYGPPDPPLAQAYTAFYKTDLYSFCLWAFDQFCLNSRPVPLEFYKQKVVATNATYLKPRMARAYAVTSASDVVVTTESSSLNRFALNKRRINQ